MNQLTKYLISEILDGQKVTAVFGGAFKPPTKGHFDIVKKALDDYKEIDKFVIYVGGGVRDGITQEQAIQIWQMYKELLGDKVEIIPSKNPIGDVKRYSKNNPDEKVYFVIGAREGREDDLADVAQRTAGVEETYPNTEVKLIPTPDGGMSGTNARKALKSGNKEEFFTYLPEKVPASEKESIWDLLNNALVKENLTKEDQVDQLERLLDRWSAYSGQYDLLPQIAKLAKGLRVNNGPSIVYRAVPGLDEYPYTKQEIIDFDKEQEIVSTTSTKEQAEYFINNNADWAYILEYKPHIIINFDEFEEKYGWTGNWGEGELLIDVPKSKLLKITKVDIIKEASDPQAGTALPYGSGYKKVNEIGVKLSNYSGQVLAGDVVRAPKGFPLGGKKLEKSLELKVKKISREGVNRYKLSLEDSDGKNYTVRNYQMDGEYKGEKLPKWGLVRKSKENVNENTIPSIDIVQKCAELTQHMIDKGYNIQPLPSVKFIGDDSSNAENFLGQTAYYNPDEKMIVVYTYGRHPKDIVRSFAHEMIHHMQNLEGRLGDITTTDTTEDDRLNDLEKEANLKGTMEFRNWTDGLKKTT